MAVTTVNAADQRIVTVGLPDHLAHILGDQVRKACKVVLNDPRFANRDRLTEEEVAYVTVRCLLSVYPDTFVEATNPESPWENGR